MSAMILPATISYDMTLFSASIVIAIVAAIAALWLAFNLRGHLQRFGSAFVMGAAVCGMHYTGMAALILTPNGSIARIVSGNNLVTSMYIFLSTAIVLSVLLVIAIMSSAQADELVFGD